MYVFIVLAHDITVLSYPDTCPQNFEAPVELLPAAAKLTVAATLAPQTGREVLDFKTSSRLALLGSRWLLSFFVTLTFIGCA